MSIKREFKFESRARYHIYIFHCFYLYLIQLKFDIRSIINSNTIIEKLYRRDNLFFSCDMQVYLPDYVPYICDEPWFNEYILNKDYYNSEQIAKYCDMELIVNLQKQKNLNKRIPLKLLFRNPKLTPEYLKYFISQDWWVLIC